MQLVFNLFIECFSAVLTYFELICTCFGGVDPSFFRVVNEIKFFVTDMLSILGWKILFMMVVTAD